jgi:hypothetical protein
MSGFRVSDLVVSMHFERHAESDNAAAQAMQLR